MATKARSEASSANTSLAQHMNAEFHGRRTLQRIPAHTVRRALHRIGPARRPRPHRSCRYFPARGGLLPVGGRSAAHIAFHEGAQGNKHTSRHENKLSRREDRGLGSTAPLGGAITEVMSQPQQKESAPPEVTMAPLFRQPQHRSHFEFPPTIDQLREVMHSS